MDDENLVDSDVCVWCKEEPADDVEMNGLETGEQLCDPCLSQLRDWKDKYHFWSIVSTAIPEDDRREIQDAAYPAGREKMDELGYTGEDHDAEIINASEGRVSVDDPNA